MKNLPGKSFALALLLASIFMSLAPASATEATGGAKASATTSLNDQPRNDHVAMTARERNRRPYRPRRWPRGEDQANLSNREA